MNLSKNSIQEDKNAKINIKEEKSNMLINNMSLKSSLESSKIEQCKKIFKDCGVYAVPIIGKLPDSKMIVLHGQCEIEALRAIGESKVSTIVVDVENLLSIDRLSLQFIQLNRFNTSLSEAILAEKLYSSHQYTLQQIAGIANKSKGMISKMIRMIRNMVPGIVEMVNKNQLSVRMAICISKLPQDVQLEFATTTKMSLLPQRDIEKIVPIINSEDTTNEIKKLIIKNPSEGLKYIKQSEKRKLNHKSANRDVGSQKPSDCYQWTEVQFLRVLVVELEKKIAQEIVHLNDLDKKTLKELNIGIVRLYKLIDRCVDNDVSHGKQEL